MSKQHECTEEHFLNDVKDHQISIEKDDGVHRFVRFRRAEGSGYWFDLITWPGNLCISGDCGTYVFSRTNDMFGFFRSENGKLSINPHYWGEKLQSIGTNAGYKEFYEDGFVERVKQHFDNFIDGADYNDKTKCELWDEIAADVICASSDGEHHAYAAVANFRHDLPDDECFEFVDFFDGGGTEKYTFHYIWILYAIVWGIMKYDEAKK